MNPTSAKAMAMLFGSMNAGAQELPPVPAGLLETAAIACVMIDNQGAVRGAIVVGSAGSASKDQEVVAWVKQLHWPAAQPGEKLRNVWFPMPVAFGSAKVPEMPPSCGPTARLTSSG